MNREHKGFFSRLYNQIIGIKHLKLKIVSIFLIFMLLTLQLSPFMLQATATQLQYYSPGLVTPATDVYYQKNVFFSNSTLGGETAYCVDYGRSLPSGTMTYYKQLSAQGVSILVYGYPNTSPAEMGCASADEAYMATQLAFWTVLQKTGESEGPRVFDLDNIYAKPGYEEFMQRAAAAAKRLNARAIADPYIPSPELNVDTTQAKFVNQNGNIVTGPYILNVTGGTVSSIKASLSGAPSSAKIIDGNGNEKSTFSNGEAVYVSISENEQGSTMTLNVFADTNKVTGSIYTSGNDSVQNFVKLDTIPVELSTYVDIKWGTQTGAVEVYKVDQNEDPVAGASFELRNGNGETLAEGTTGSNGYIKFSNVTVGQYELVETEVPSGYIGSDESIIFNVTAGNTYSVTVENEKISGSLQIKKKDTDNNPIPNVTFEILDEDRDKITEVTTNEEGIARVNNLANGTYYFREIKVPVNVIMDSSLHEFNITRADQVVTREITNELITGGIKIVKTDENELPIEGVKFQLLNSAKQVVTTATTNSSGIAVFNNLSVGTYYYQEIEVPEGYVIDNTEHVFSITNTQQLLTENVVNQVMKAKLRIVKKTNDDTPIANVKFEILNEDKQVLETITTNESGIAETSSLPVGTYYYKEVEAPNYVIMDTNEYKFKLSNNDQIIEKIIVNELAKAKLKIIKKSNENTPIGGVKFEILDQNKQVLETITTNESGIAETSNLSVGTYYYKEVEAPGYVVMDSEEHEVRLSSNNQIVERTVINELIKEKLKITKKNNLGEIISGVKFEILDENKNVVETITTNESGIAETSSLPIGKYYYKEVAAPDNVIMDTNEYVFQLSTNNQVLEKTVINNLVKERLKIIKVDENNKPIANAKFQILNSDKSVIEEIITNEEGIALSSELSAGVTYYYKEIEVPFGYTLDSTEKAFRVTENSGVIVKRAVNNIQTGELEIIKKDNNQNPIEGVEFQILDANKNVIDTITTNSEGIATIQELMLGTYYYQEISAPSDLKIDETLYAFRISENNQIVTRTVINELITGKLEIVKVDENKLPIANVTFAIKDENKTIIQTIKTNENGIALSDPLTKGKYYYQEIETADGYILDDKEYVFVIDGENEIIQKKVINQFVRGNLRIEKLDTAGKPLSGVQFEILNENKEVVETLTTNSEGIAISNPLLKGKYYYRESKVPDGIKIDTTEHIFVISENDQIIQKRVINEYLEKGTLEIYKVDENSIPIENVTFQILDSQKNIVEEITTNAEGKATSSDLKIGTYYYKEISAPDEYVMDTTEHKFVLSEDNQVVYKTVINTHEKGSLKIIKVDENDVPLQGIVFHILNSNQEVIQTITTNEAGIAVSNELQKGNYYYQEVEVPENILIDRTIYPFEVSENNQIVIKNMVNEYLKGNLKIIKTDENNKPLAGVKFHILDSNKTVIDTIITNEEGIATKDSLLIGTYYYQEIEAPEHVIIDSNQYEFSITAQNLVVEKSIVNKYEKSSLKIIKVDEENHPIANVTFAILDENKQKINEIVTNEEGIAILENMSLGTYYYQELSVPNEYVKDETIYEFRISEYGQTITKTVVNKLATGRLRIQKVDENNIPLAGVKFDILDHKQNYVETIVTDENGIALSDFLELGKYYYQEIEAPEHVIIDNKIYEFSITQNNEIVIKNMTNFYKKSSLKIIKVDENNHPIANVTFAILDENKQKINEIITNEEGIAILENMSLGTYYYQELSVPNGYVKDDTIYEFRISEYEQMITKTVVNQFARGSLKVIKVDENSVPLAGIKFNILDSNQKYIQTIVTDENGIAQTSNLILGTYYYQEVEAPEYVIMDNTIYEFTISENNEVVIKNIVNYYEKSTFTIIKVDENEIPLQGITFDILDSNKNVIDTIVTDENGVAKSKELSLGTYYYQETKVPDGLVLDNHLYEFEVTGYGQNVIKNMINYYVRGKFQIIKRGLDGKVLAGARFNILDENQNIIDTIQTGENGIAISDDLIYGKYYYQEIEAPVDYELDDTLYSFEITRNDEIIIREIENEYIYGKLKITKLDKESSKPIEGVKFNILDQDKNIITTITTDQEGIAVMERLVKGTYFYQEIEAPEGYVIDEKVYQFRISENNQLINKVITNEKILGGLKITKFDKKSEAPIQGVKYQILDQNKNVITTITTDENGIATIDGLEKGKYYYQEIEAPEGYIIDDKIYQFNISKNEQIINKIMINEQVYGALKIIKTDKDTRETIEGVEFKILNSNREEVGTYVTDQEGIIEVENLPYGTYYYKEMKTPENYYVDNEEYSFDIEKDEQVVVKKIKNEREKLPVTGGIISTNILIIVAVSIVSIIGYVLFNVLRDKKTADPFKFKSDDFVDDESNDKNKDR